MAAIHPFHLAFPVHDLDQARAFYRNLLGCAEGRSSNEWIDFDFYGHQIVAHLALATVRPDVGNQVDGKHVPVPHFGAVLPMEEWQALATRLQQAGVDFVIEPHIRFQGQVGEQATMFFYDPSHNAIEIKGFADMGQLFAS